MTFKIDKIASVFFELGSHQRLDILLHLEEKSWTVSALSKELDATITEVHRNFVRLQKAGLILKKMDGTYNLTLLGKNFCLQVPSIVFVSENKQYFEKHGLGDLPVKFQHRIGEISKNKQIKGFVRVLEKWKEIHNNSHKYIYNILPEIPYNKDIIDIVEKKLNKVGLPCIDYRVSADYGKVVIMKSNQSSSTDLIGPPVNMCAKINHIASTNSVVIGGDLYSMVKGINDYRFKELTGFSLGFKHPYPVYGVEHKR